MKFKNVVKGLKVNLPQQVLDANVKRVVADSRKVKKGDVFVLLKDDDLALGKIEQAFDNGAKFVLCNKDYFRANCFVMGNLRRAFAIMNKNLHHCACDRLKLIGVTGTNGKTTVTNLVYDILKGDGKRVGLIGTLGYKIMDEFVDTGFTTPDPDILHDIFKKMLKAKVEYVVMEVSAHALYLQKLAGIKLEIGVLTNITQDHLDFFKTMQNYTDAKLMLFQEDMCNRAVVCSDAINLPNFQSQTSAQIFSYAINSPSNVFAVNIHYSLDGTQFFCNCNDELFFVKTPLVGEFNVQNTLAAISVCYLAGVRIETIKNQLAVIPPIEGRFNILDIDGRKIIVDFAHTPDGLEKVISTVRQLADGRVLTLFGCGGERDEKKRPVMGKISTSLSDKVCFTSDNPRYDDPLKIIDDIKRGAEKQNYFIEPDRAKAICKILDLSQEGDSIIIAGKGGEKYQDIQGKKVPYNDFDEIYNYFRGKIKIIGGGK